MQCPACHGAMTAEELQGHLGRPLTIDICFTCQAFWFDARESLRLAPASTLSLFRQIGERSASGAAPPATGARCPRCGQPLRLAHDMQRTTKFEYWTCPNGHGRFTTFFNFLREKNFIRPMTPAQVAELRQHLSAVNCSNCGASVDLAAGTACTHCGSPLSVLDLKQAQTLVTELQHADRTDKPVDPALPLRLERSRRELNAAFDAFERDQTWFSDVPRSGLVGAGLTALAKWMKRDG